jgi:hypothetical protein
MHSFTVVAVAWVVIAVAFGVVANDVLNRARKR